MGNGSERAPTCDFCGERLVDPMLAFLEHVAQSTNCRTLWEEWKANVRRESGGT